MCAVNALIAPYFIAYEKQRFVLLLGELSSIIAWLSETILFGTVLVFNPFYNSGNLVQHLQCLLCARFLLVEFAWNHLKVHLDIYRYHQQWICLPS